MGRLVSSQVWTLDENGYLSANRKAFTLWLYKASLPDLWELYQVMDCTPGDQFGQCVPAPDGPYTQSYSANGVNFTGLLPQGLGCQSVCGQEGCLESCAFTPPSQATVNVVWARSRSNAHTRPAAAMRGCTRIPTATRRPRAARSAWGPKSSTIKTDGSSSRRKSTPTPMVPTAWCWGQLSGASLLDAAGHATIRLQGIAPLRGDLDLRTVRLRISRLFRELRGSEELVKDTSGNDFDSIVLSPNAGAGATQAML